MKKQTVRSDVPGSQGQKAENNAKGSLSLQATSPSRQTEPPWADDGSIIGNRILESSHQAEPLFIPEWEALIGPK